LQYWRTQSPKPAPSHTSRPKAASETASEASRSLGRPKSHPTAFSGTVLCRMGWHAGSQVGELPSPGSGEIVAAILFLTARSLHRVSASLIHTSSAGASQESGGRSHSLEG